MVAKSFYPYLPQWRTSNMKLGRVRLVFVGARKGVSKWPNIRFDPKTRAKELIELIEAKYSDIEFIKYNIVTNREEAEKVLEELGKLNEEVLVIFNLASSWFLPSEIVSKIPTVVVSDPLLWGYAGMVSLSRALREHEAKGFIVSSSKWSDIDSAFNVIRAYLKLKSSKLLLVGKEVKEDVTEARALGVNVVKIGFEEIEEEFKRASIDKASEIAEQVMKKAEGVIGVSPKDIRDSARLYLALKKILQKYEADGIAIDCLGGFARGELSAYPCLAFMLLDDEGEYVCACENDLNSLITKLVMKYIARRPGFLSEPAIDTSNNLAIYAHCVAPLKMNGYESAPEPYLIRTHAEDDKGVSIQVLFRSNVPVTIVKFVLSEKRVLLLSGELLGNMEKEVGCRSKAIVKVEDAQKLIDTWQHSWHRVLYYGNWSREIRWLAKLLGYRVHLEIP